MCRRPEEAQGGKVCHGVSVARNEGARLDSVAELGVHRVPLVGLKAVRVSLPILLLATVPGPVWL